MENALNISPGLMIWTMINFLILLFILVKFGVKPIVNGLKAREDKIRNSIESAEKANQDAQLILKESHDKLLNASKEMSDIVHKGRIQAEELIKKASEEADKIKKQKVDESIKEILRNKDIAIKELRTEVASLAVEAAEKILGEVLDKEKHFKMVEKNIDQLPKN